MVSITTMEKPDYLDLDGRQLQILLTIHVAGSLSAAARMLDMNQSTVSYWLDLLRKRLGDPLFVRAGNGVQPTERAKALLPIARETLRQLKSICETEDYDPAVDTGALRLAGSAMERDLVIAPLIRQGIAIAPNMTFELSPSGSAFQVVERLRNGPLDFVLMPDQVSEGDGIMRRAVLKFVDAVYFDVGHPLSPDDLDAFCTRPQARVALGPDAGFEIDRRLAKLGKKRHVALQVGDFDTALRLIQGTPIIATLPSHLARGSADQLGSIDPPWAQEPRNIMLYWHGRNQNSARHKFWRDRIREIGQGV